MKTTNKTRIFAHKAARQLTNEEIDVVTIAGGAGVTFPVVGSLSLTFFCGSGPTNAADDLADGTPV